MTMNTMNRLAMQALRQKPLILSTALRNALTSQSFRPMTMMSKQSSEEYNKLNYTDRQKKMGRPVSPHVTIYAFPMTAISSITNRVTGCALSVGCAGLGVAELVGGSGSSLYIMQTIGGMGPLVAASAKFTVSFPLVYHYLGAIRHLYWDMTPEILTIEQTEKSSYILFGASTAISGLTMLV